MTDSGSLDDNSGNQSPNAIPEYSLSQRRCVLSRQELDAYYAVCSAARRALQLDQATGPVGSA